MKIKITGDQHRQFEIFEIKIEGDKKEYYIDQHSNFGYFYGREDNPKVVSNIILPYFNALRNFHSMFSDNPHYKHTVKVAISPNNNYGVIENIPQRLQDEFLEKVEAFVIKDLKDKIKLLKDNKIKIEYEKILHRPYNKNLKTYLDFVALPDSQKKLARRSFNSDNR